MILYYETTEKEAKQLLKHGFKERARSRSFYYNFTDLPFVGDEAAPVDAVLEVDLKLPDAAVAAFETTVDGGAFHAFRLPGVWINKFGNVSELKEVEPA